ncbi:MAG: hypothetical protein OES99_08590, partial [Gammaproteobacteria bacterium]|nr:hypothetical protein [Gammaproteobacteria bacterium]
DPDQPPCDCYFSNDCNDGNPGTQLFCDFGPGSFFTEDVCAWRDIKPNGVFGAGCSIESDLTTGAWVPSICDGICTPEGGGSSVGLEDTALIAQTIEYWGAAMIDPSAGGGGPVDAKIAAQATAVQFNAANAPMVLGRHAADALAMAAGESFHDYFCHWEGHPEDGNPPVVDLAGDTCRITSGRLTIQALVSEIQTPGSAAAIMAGIVDACPNWRRMFSTQCTAGPGALNCAIEFIEAQAYFLRTPRISPATVPSLIDELLGN